jgi:hypothetical protein
MEMVIRESKSHCHCEELRWAAVSVARAMEMEGIVRGHDDR